MRSYWELLRTKGVFRITASQILARFPNGMISLALLIHVQRIFDAYSAAGLVLAAASIGQAIAGPVTSRLMGKLGARRVLISTMLACSFALLWIAYFPMPLWGYLVASFLAALTFPPIQPAVRTMYPKLVESAKLPRLFSLDASAQEIIWIIGPLIATTVCFQVSPPAALLTCVFFLIGGGFWFVCSPELGTVHFTRSTGRFGAVLKRGSVLLSSGVSIWMIGSYAAFEAAVVKRFGEGGSEIGIILGVMAVASMISGIAFGHRPARRFTLTAWMAYLFFGCLLVMADDSFLWTLAASALGGFGMAPAIAVLFAMIASSLRFEDTAEAYGWVNTGQVIGGALGSAVAGYMIDWTGANGGFVAAAVFALLSLLTPLCFYSLRDARRRTIQRRKLLNEPLR